MLIRTTNCCEVVWFLLSLGLCLSALHGGLVKRAYKNDGRALCKCTELISCLILNNTGVTESTGHFLRTKWLTWETSKHKCEVKRIKQTKSLDSLMVSLSHHWLGPNLPRESLKWNIQRSIEFPTSTNSPYPRMAPGNRETNNNNNLCFPTQPGWFVTVGKSLSAAQVYQKVTSRLKYLFTWIICFRQTLVLSLHFSASVFRRSKTFTLFPSRCQTLLSLSAPFQ